jgi:hypothetical protein
MAMIDNPSRTGSIDSKSKVAELQQKIENLVREAYRTGDTGLMAQAARLSRQKEQLLKPAAMRKSDFLQAS